jgi:hypothetical protein
VISIARTHCRNVKHWQNGQMALRWCAAGMTEAGKQFRRINGHLHLPALRKALEHHVAAETFSATRQNESVIAARSQQGPPPKFNDGRDILLAARTVAFVFAPECLWG